MTHALDPLAPVTRVFLVEDYEAVRRGIAKLLGDEPDLEVVGEAGTVAEALRLAPLTDPDVAVLDVRLPDGDGVTACRELRSRLPHLRCVLLTSLAEQDALLAAILGGAAGYRLKQVRGTDIAGAVRAAAAGRSLVDPETRAVALERIRSLAGVAESVGDLSADERTALELISAGMSNREIAERTACSEDAARDSVNRLLATLGIQRLTGASAAADARGMR